MEISFVKMSPTQNVTILVESFVPRAEQPRIAEALLAYDSVAGEQVGFLEKSDVAALRLQMMGGEFCGNAAMSAAAYWAWKDGMRDGEVRDVPIEISGARDALVCRVEKNGGFRGTVAMPLPEGFSEVTLPTDGGTITAPVVRMPGIKHIILTEELPRAEIERRVRGWNKIVGAEALGVLHWRAGFMTPFVYVRGTDTAVWERGCGSGSAALGAWMARARRGSVRESIAQPGGVIDVSAALAGGGVTALRITGNVRVTAKGVAYL